MVAIVQPLSPSRGFRNCARPGRECHRVRPHRGRCCESFLRNALSIGRIKRPFRRSTWSREKDFPDDPASRIVPRGPDREVRRIDGRAGDSLRLFAAHRHCAAVAAGFIGWPGSRTPISGRRSFRRWQHRNPAACSIRVFLDLDGYAEGEARTESSSGSSRLGMRPFQLPRAGAPRRCERSCATG